MSADKKPAEPPHIESLRRQHRLNKLSAANKFRIVGGKVEKYESSSSCHLEAAIIAAVKTHERSANVQIGDMDERGIFLGVWEPKDKSGNSLKKKFNVFAAPENLQQGFTYDNAVSHIAGLKDWHGHDGADYANDAALYEALEKETYEGGWFIPPGELVFGKNADGTEVMRDNLRAHRYKGAFNDTFNEGSWRGNTEFYWTSTVPGSENFKTQVVRFENGFGFYALKDECHFSCRPVRLEPKP